MFRKYFLPSFGLVGSIICLVLSINLFPVLMGGWAIACLIGAAFGIIGSIMVLISRKSNASWIENSKRWVCGIGLVLFFLTFIVWGLIDITSDMNQLALAAKNPIETVSTVSEEEEISSESPEISQETGLEANETITSLPVEVGELVDEPNGIDIPRNCWQHIKAGTVISGDIAIFNGDNNNDITIINDGASKTADIILVTHDMNIWFEYGAYAIPSATEEEIRNLILEKLGDYEVRYFPDLQKLDGGYWYYQYSINNDGTTIKSDNLIQWIPVLDESTIHPTDEIPTE